MRPIKGMAMIAALSVPLALAGCGSESSSADGTVRFVTFGSVYEEAQKKTFVDPFVSETGINVVTDSPTDLAKLKVMVSSGNVTWDVYLAEQHEPVGYCGELFEELDFTNIDKDDFAPGTVSPCGVPMETYSYVLAYNTEKYGSNPPTSIKDFFDPAGFPGVRAMSNVPSEGNLEMALIADGVSRDDLYPLDYDRAFATLDKIKDGLLFWEAGAEQVELMDSQRADMILVWSGRGYEAAENGAPYVPVWEGSSLHWASFAIPKGSPNKEAAQKFIDFAVSPEPQAAFSEAIAYGPANKRAKPVLDESRQEWDASKPQNMEAQFSIDNQWWADNQETVLERWSAWTSG